MRAQTKGMTLVEALVALAVFAVGMGALIPLVVATARANRAAATRTQALALCQHRLEGFRALPYGALASHSPASGTELIDDAGAVGGAEAFTRDWDIRGMAGEPDLLRVTVSVRWRQPGIPDGAVTLVAARGRY